VFLIKILDICATICQKCNFGTRVKSKGKKEQLKPSGVCHKYPPRKERGKIFTTDCSGAGSRKNKKSEKILSYQKKAKKNPSYLRRKKIRNFGHYCFISSSHINQFACPGCTANE